MAKTPDQQDTKVIEFHRAEPRGFEVILPMLEDGQLLTDCTRQLSELCAELSRQSDAINGQVKGEFLLKLKFTAKGGAVDVDGDITIKKPKPARRRSVLWVNPKGALANENPKQLQLGQLREMPGGKRDAELRAPGDRAETGE